MKLNVVRRIRVTATTGTEERQRDEAQALPRRGAVHRRRLVDLGGNALERCVVQEDVERRGPPHVRGDHRPHGQPGVTEPVDIVGDQPELVERAVQVAELRVDDE
jgi:hypothetical protein